MVVIHRDIIIRDLFGQYLHRQDLLGQYLLGHLLGQYLFGILHYLHGKYLLGQYLLGHLFGQYLHGQYLLGQYLLGKYLHGQYLLDQYLLGKYLHGQYLHRQDILGQYLFLPGLKIVVIFVKMLGRQMLARQIVVLHKKIGKDLIQKEQEQEENKPNEPVCDYWLLIKGEYHDKSNSQQQNYRNKTRE